MSGTISLVRLAAMTPARCAVASTSPLGARSLRSRRSVSRCMKTRPRAVAERRVTRFPPTSTMRTRPDASVCESRRAMFLTLGRGIPSVNRRAAPHPRESRVNAGSDARSHA